MEHLDGRTKGPVVAAGRVEAAAVAAEVAAEVFVMVTKTERGGEEGGTVERMWSVFSSLAVIFSATAALCSFSDAFSQVKDGWLCVSNVI